MLTNSRVLIVGDDPNQAELIAELLRYNGADQVRTAGSLQELWERLEADRYNLLLLNWDLPGGDRNDALPSLPQRGSGVPNNASQIAAISELASRVAHLVNNPLTTIIAEAQILLQNLPEAHRGRDSAEAIEAAGWRVQKTVQQLLDFSQSPPTNQELLDVNTTISNALLLVIDEINASGMKLQVELADGLPPISGNPSQLTHLWLRLLTAAHPAALDGTPRCITIRSEIAPGGGVQVEVCTAGEYFPTGEMPAPLEPNTSTPGESHGIGIELTICQEIVRQHKGQICAESHPGGDTILRVTFPVEVIP